MNKSFRKKYDFLLSNLTNIVWNTELKKDNTSTIYKNAYHLVRNLYLLLISLTCLISLLTLFKPGPSIANAWYIFISILQIFSFFFFAIDYILHLITYNKFLESKKLYLNHHQTIFKYVFSFRGIILFLCVLSSIHVISNIGAIDPSVSKVFDTFKFLNIARIIRFFTILSIFTPFKLIYGVFEKQKKVLFNVLIISIFLIIIFALLIWNSETTHLYEVQDNFLASNKIKRGWISIYESYINNHVENLKKDEIINWLGSHNINQDNFDLVKSKYKEFQNLSNSYVTSFIDSLYFSTITLTTIGYGDFTPHAQISKVIVSLNSLLAIAIVAIPSGVVASEFLLLTQQKLKKEEQERKKDDSLLASSKTKIISNSESPNFIKQKNKTQTIMIDQNQIDNNQNLQILETKKLPKKINSKQTRKNLKEVAKND